MIQVRLLEVNTAIFVIKYILYLVNVRLGTAKKQIKKLKDSSRNDLKSNTQEANKIWIINEL